MCDDRTKGDFVKFQTTASGFFDRFSEGLWDPKVKRRFGQYLFQVGLATLSLVVILLVEDALARAAIVVSIGSTVFIVFIIPDSVAATPRRVVGGHVVAIICGSALAFLLQAPFLDTFAENHAYVRDVAAALAVGLSIMLMVFTNTEHPPAAGTALGLLIPGWSLSAIVFILLSTLALSVIRVLLRPKMINLL